MTAQASGADRRVDLAAVEAAVHDAFHRFRHNGQCRQEARWYSACTAYQQAGVMARSVVRELADAGLLAASEAPAVVVPTDGGDFKVLSDALRDAQESIRRLLAATQERP